MKLFYLIALLLCGDALGAIQVDFSPSCKPDYVHLGYNGDKRHKSDSSFKLSFNSQGASFGSNPFTLTMQLAKLGYNALFKSPKRKRESFAKQYHSWSAGDFDNYFSNQYLKECNWFGDEQYAPQAELAILQQYHLYQFSSFQSFINELSHTQEFLQKLNRKLAANLDFEKQIGKDAGYTKGEFKQLVGQLLNRFATPPTEKRVNYSPQRQKETQLHEQFDHQRAVLTEITQAYSEGDLVSNSHEQQERYADRKKAIDSTAHAPKYTQKRYAVSFDLKRLLEEHCASHSLYEVCYGNQIQQVLHAELLSVLDRAAHMRHQTPSNRESVEQLIRHIVNFSGVSAECNKEGFVAKSMVLVDFCWASLDCCFAVGQGVFDGVYNTSNIIRHPIETVENLASSVAVAGYCLGKVMSVGCELTSLRFTDPLAHMHRQRQIKKSIDEIYSAVATKFNETPDRELIRKGSAFATEMILTRKCLGAVSKFFSAAKTNLPHYLSALDNGFPPLAPQAIMAGGCEVAIASEGALVLTQAAEKAAETGIALAKAIESLGPIVPISREISGLKGWWSGVRGFGQFEHLYVDFEDGFRHIYEISIREQMRRRGMRRIINGFHHDYLHRLEKAGVIKLENVKYYAEGFYSAIVEYNGVRKYKTQFPANWSHEKITRTVVVFYEKYKHLAVYDRGDWLIEQYFLPGVKIRMIITPEMILKTVYPVFD